MNGVEIAGVIIQSVGVIIQVVVVCLTLITILFIASQTRDVAQQTRHYSTSTISSLYEQIAEQMILIDQIFIKEPKLRAFFYERRQIDKENEDYQKIIAIAETFLDLMDMVMVLIEITQQYQTDKVFQSHLSGWRLYFQDMYKISPAIRLFYHEHKAWYVENLQNLFDNVILED